MNEKAPSANIQAPEKLQAPNTKKCGALDWSLKLGASLDVGAWNLEL
jgi:hypothetical protein